MTDNSQQLEASRADFQAAADSLEEASRAADFQAADSLEEASQAAADSLEGASQVGMTTFLEEASHHLAAAEVTNTVHHQAHRLLTHRNKVFLLSRLTLVPLEDVDSASRIFG